MGWRTNRKAIMQKPIISTSRYEAQTNQKCTKVTLASIAYLELLNNFKVLKYERGGVRTGKLSTEAVRIREKVLAPSLLHLSYH
jgi:hypothetical protein